jgi:hypothetical protein
VEKRPFLAQKLGKKRWLGLNLTVWYQPGTAGIQDDDIDAPVEDTSVR